MLSLTVGSNDLLEPFSLTDEPPPIQAMSGQTLIVEADSVGGLTANYSGSVTNAGLFIIDGNPSLTISGDYSQAPSGVTRIDVGLPTQSPFTWSKGLDSVAGGSSSQAFLRIGGKAFLAGTLDVSGLTSQQVLSVGDRIPLMRFDGLEGRFDLMTGMEVPSDPTLFLSLQYRMPTTGAATGATGIDLVVMEKPRLIRADGSVSRLDQTSQGAGLLVVTHGFNSNVTKPGNEFAAIAQGIAAKGTGWDTTVFDWSYEADSSTGGWLPWWTAERAYDAGDSLRMWLESSGFNYDNFHLVAHSAGTWVISAMADGLPAAKNVEAALLDGFTPSNTRIAGIGPAVVSRNFDRGINVYAEDLLASTQDHRDHLVNIDVTKMRVGNENWQNQTGSHARPYRWYLETVQATLPATPTLRDRLGYQMAPMAADAAARQLLETDRGRTYLVSPTSLRSRGQATPAPSRMPLPSGTSDPTVLRVAANELAGALRIDEADAGRITGAAGEAPAAAGFSLASTTAGQTLADIPVFGPAAATAATDLVTEMLGYSSDDLSLDDLFDLGFQIQAAATADDIYRWAYGDVPLPAGLLEATYTRQVSSTAALGAGGSLALGSGDSLLSAQVAGSLEGGLSATGTLTTGLDLSQGVYVVEGGTFALAVNGSARVGGTATVADLVDAELAAQATLAAALRYRLDDGDQVAGERLFLSGRSLADVLRGTGTAALTGALELDAVRVTSVGFSIVKGAGSYNLATGLGTFAISADGLDSDDLALMIRRLASPLADAADRATATIAAIPGFLGSSFSFGRDLFAFEDRIGSLVDGFAERIAAEPTVSGSALLDRLGTAISDAFAITNVDAPPAEGNKVRDVSFDLDLSRQLFSRTIAFPDSFKVGGFTIDTQDIPDINVTAAVRVQTRVRITDGDGLQILVNAGRTKVDFDADISSDITFRGKVARLLDFSGLLQPRYQPAFQIGFSGGEMSPGQLLGNFAPIQTSDATRYLTMPVRIKLDPVDPLPAFDYRTTFRFDLTAIDGSTNSASFSELNPGVYFRDINVSNGPGPIVYELFRRSGGPVLEKINNAIPPDVRDVLLGTKSLGPAFGNITINDMIGARYGLGYDTPLDLVPYGLAATTGIPPQVVKPVTDGLERILKLSALLDRAKAEWAGHGDAGPSAEAASSSETLREARELGLQFPVMDNLVLSVARILAGDPGVPLVTFTYDLADQLLQSITDGLVNAQQLQAAQEELDKFVRASDRVVQSRLANAGRIVVDIDTRDIKAAIVRRLVGKADDAIADILRFLLDAYAPIDFGLTFGLASSVTVGVDTAFLAPGSPGQRVLSSIYLDTTKPLFDLAMEVRVEMQALGLPGSSGGLSLAAESTNPGSTEPSATLEQASDLQFALFGGVVRDAWNRGKEFVAPAINPVTKGLEDLRDGLVASAEELGQIAVDRILEEANNAIDQGKEWIKKALAYAPSIRFGGAVGGEVTLGVRAGREAGKLRLNEVLDGEAALYANGNLSAEMAAVFKGLGRSKKFETGRRTLISFDTNRVRHDGVGGVALGGLSIEPNEFAELVGSELVVFGSVAADSVEITASGSLVKVVFNGVTQTFPEAAVTRISVSLDGVKKPQGNRIRPGLGVAGGDDTVLIASSLPSRIEVTVLGGGGNDSFTARAGSTEFGGKITFRGGGGQDELTGGGGQSFLYGDDGADIVRAGTGFAVLDGGASDDVLSGPTEGGGTRNSGGIMAGGDGSDVLNVGIWSTGDWILVGGRLDSAGDQSPNFLYGGVGNDLLVAGDLFRIGGVPQPAATGGGPATMLGGSGDDSLYGSPFDDVCIGGDYDDSSFSGVDQIHAGDGKNLITPGNFMQAEDPALLVATDADVAGSAGRPELATGGDGFDTFRLGVAATTISFQGEGGSDLFEIGTGDISLITGPVSINAGPGDDDRIMIDDSGTNATVDYLLTPVALTATAGGPPTMPSASSTRFGGLTYDGSTEYLTLEGSQGVNVFDVQPSLATAYALDGNGPLPGFVEASKGDYLKLDTKTTFPEDLRGFGLDTSGRRLSIESRGQGRWDFTKGTGHQSVGFESFERFNHVDVVAAAADAGKTSSPVVHVFDSETLEPLFTIPATRTFGRAYRGGVRVATGDLDNDGLPDVAVAPGRMAAPVVKVFNGSPQPDLQGTEILNQRLAARTTFGARYAGGVNITVGDVTGDTLNEVILSRSRGPAVVKVFENSLVPGIPFAQLGQAAARAFNAFPRPRRYQGGSSVAVADVGGLGKQQIVVGSGVGMRGLVRVFDVRTPAATYAAMMQIADPTVPAIRGGLHVAAGDLDGDGRAEIVTGAGAAGGSRVRIYSGADGSHAFMLQTGTRLAATIPARVAVRSIDGDSRMAVFATWGADARRNYRIMRMDSPLRQTIDELSVSGSGLSGGGINIG